jgi:hypothetical protein
MSTMTNVRRSPRTGTQGSGGVTKKRGTSSKGECMCSFNVIDAT